MKNVCDWAKWNLAIMGWIQRMKKDEKVEKNLYVEFRMEKMNQIEVNLSVSDNTVK